MNMTGVAHCLAVGENPEHAVILTKSSVIIYFCYIHWNLQPEGAYNYPHYSLS